MFTLSPPVYSQLCDGDRELYEKYCCLYDEYVRVFRGPGQGVVAGDTTRVEWLVSTGGGCLEAAEGTSFCIAEQAQRLEDNGDAGVGAATEATDVRAGGDGGASPVATPADRQAECSVGCGGAVDGGSEHVRVHTDGVGTVGSGKKLVGPNGGLSYGRGPNYARNLENRKRKKEKRALVGRGDATPLVSRPDGTFEGRPATLRVGVYGECDSEVRRRLANTRAERYILENERAIERMKKISVQEEVDAQKKRRDVNMRFWDGQLNGDYEMCPPGRVMGWAKTLVSKSSGSKSSSDKSSPSLSKGSTSPSSSVSQNERRLEKLCKELEQKLEVSEKEKEKYKSQFKVFQNMTRPVMTDQDRYFGRDHDFESGNDDDYYY